jgi:hypothetical protein
MGNSKSRDKGVRAEYAVRDLLREATGLEWERVPGSGGFGASHGLKGDIYLPAPTGHMSKWCLEVKHYADENFNSNILKQAKTQTQFEKWLVQTERESEEMNAEPMLIFKKDRGAWFACVPTSHDFGDKARRAIHPHAIINIGTNLREYVVVDFKALLALPNIKEELVK